MKNFNYSMWYLYLDQWIPAYTKHCLVFRTFTCISCDFHRFESSETQCTTFRTWTFYKIFGMVNFSDVSQVDLEAGDTEYEVDKYIFKC